jgi:hypothetical protein
MSSYSLVYYLVEMITIFVSLCRTIAIGMITFCDPCRLNIIMDYDCVLYNRAVYQLSVRVSILPTLKNSCMSTVNQTFIVNNISRHIYESDYIKFSTSADYQYPRKKKLFQRLNETILLSKVLDLIVIRRSCKKS